MNFKITIGIACIILLLNIINAKLTFKIDYMHNNDSLTRLNIKDFDENDSLNF